MRRNKWIAVLIMMLWMLSANVYAGKVTVGEIQGLVMLNKDGSFIKVKTGMELKVGDQIYVLESSSALLLQGTNCAARLNANELFELKKSDLCANNSHNIRSRGSKFVAAIGLDEPDSDSNSSLNDSVSNTELSEGQENRVTNNAELAAQSGGFFSGLSAKLAIPATLTGAVLFSTISGGGGVRTDPTPEPISPE